MISLWRNKHAFSLVTNTSFWGLRDNCTYSRCFQNSTRTAAGSKRFVRRLKVLNCIFLKGKMHYNPKYFVRFGQVLVSLNMVPKGGI